MHTKAAVNNTVIDLKAQKINCLRDALVEQALQQGIDLTDITELYLDDAYLMSTSEFSCLSTLTSLKVLILSSLRVNGTIIDTLPSELNPALPTIEELYIKNTKFTSLSSLQSCTQLKILHAEGSPISDISALSFLTSLTELGLIGTLVVDLTALENNSNIEVLELMGCKLNCGSICFIKKIPSLRELYVDEDTGISSDELLLLQDMPALEYLEVPEETPWHVARDFVLTRALQLRLKHAFDADDFDQFHAMLDNEYANILDIHAGKSAFDLIHEKKFSPQTADTATEVSQKQLAQLETTLLSDLAHYPLEYTLMEYIKLRDWPSICAAQKLSSRQKESFLSLHAAKKRNPLHVAGLLGNDYILIQLLQWDKQNPLEKSYLRYPDENNHTPIYLAYQQGNYAAVFLMLGHLVHQHQKQYPDMEIPQNIHTAVFAVSEKTTSRAQTIPTSIHEIFSETLQRWSQTLPLNLGDVSGTDLLDIRAHHYPISDHILQNILDLNTALTSITSDITILIQKCKTVKQHYFTNFIQENCVHIKHLHGQINNKTSSVDMYSGVDDIIQNSFFLTLQELFTSTDSLFPYNQSFIPTINLLQGIIDETLSAEQWQAFTVCFNIPNLNLMRETCHQTNKEQIQVFFRISDSPELCDHIASYLIASIKYLIEEICQVENISLQELPPILQTIQDIYQRNINIPPSIPHQAEISHQDKAHQRSLMLTEKLQHLTESTLEKAHIYYFLSEHEERLSQHDKALEMLNNAVKCFKESNNTNHPLYPLSLSAMGKISVRLKNKEQAVEYYQRAYHACQEYSPTQHRDLAFYAANVAYASHANNLPKRALKYYKIANENAKLALPTSDPFRLSLCQQLGKTYLGLQKYSSAQDCFTQALASPQQSPSSIAANQFLLASSYLESKNYELSLKHYQETLPILQEISPRCPDIITVLFRIGLCHHHMHQRELALSSYEIAHERAQAYSDEIKSMTGYDYLCESMGTLIQSTSVSKALNYYLSAYQIAKKSSRKQAYLSQLLALIGRSWYQLGNVKLAEKNYLDAIDLYQNSQGPLNSAYATILAEFTMIAPISLQKEYFSKLQAILAYQPPIDTNAQISVLTALGLLAADPQDRLNCHLKALHLRDTSTPYNTRLLETHHWLALDYSELQDIYPMLHHAFEDLKKHNFNPSEIENFQSYLKIFLRSFQIQLTPKEESNVYDEFFSNTPIQSLALLQQYIQKLNKKLNLPPFEQAEKLSRTPIFDVTKISPENLDSDRFLLFEGNLSSLTRLLEKYKTDSTSCTLFINAKRNGMNILGSILSKTLTYEGIERIKRILLEPCFDINAYVTDSPCHQIAKVTAIKSVDFYGMNPLHLSIYLNLPWLYSALKQRNAQFISDAVHHYPHNAYVNFTCPIVHPNYYLRSPSHLITVLGADEKIFDINHPQNAPQFPSDWSDSSGDSDDPATRSYAYKQWISDLAKPLHIAVSSHAKASDSLSTEFDSLAISPPPSDIHSSLRTLNKTLDATFSIGDKVQALASVPALSIAHYHGESIIQGKRSSQKQFAHSTKIIATYNQSSTTFDPDTMLLSQTLTANLKGKSNLSNSTETIEQVDAQLKNILTHMREHDITRFHGLLSIFTKIPHIKRDEDNHHHDNFWTSIHEYCTSNAGLEHNLLFKNVHFPFITTTKMPQVSIKDSLSFNLNRRSTSMAKSTKSPRHRLAGFLYVLRQNLNEYASGYQCTFFDITHLHINKKLPSLHRDYNTYIANLTLPSSLPSSALLRGEVVYIGHIPKDNIIAAIPLVYPNFNKKYNKKYHTDILGYTEQQYRAQKDSLNPYNFEKAKEFMTCMVSHLAQNCLIRRNEVLVNINASNALTLDTPEHLTRKALNNTKSAPSKERSDESDAVIHPRLFNTLCTARDGSLTFNTLAKSSIFAQQDPRTSTLPSEKAPTAQPGVVMTPHK